MATGAPVPTEDARIKSAREQSKTSSKSLVATASGLDATEIAALALAMAALRGTPAPEIDCKVITSVPANLVIAVGLVQPTPFSNTLRPSVTAEKVGAVLATILGVTSLILRQPAKPAMRIS